MNRFSKIATAALLEATITSPWAGTAEAAPALAQHGSHPSSHHVSSPTGKQAAAAAKAAAAKAGGQAKKAAAHQVAASEKALG